MSFEASRNQLANISNPYQGSSKKVLCVCSAGLLRSPTLANRLHIELGYNTRAVGTATNFALIPVSEALIYWADEIVFVDKSCLIFLSDEAREEIRLSEAEVLVLDLPDEFDYNAPELKDECYRQYIEANPVNQQEVF